MYECYLWPFSRSKKNKKHCRVRLMYNSWIILIVKCTLTTNVHFCCTFRRFFLYIFSVHMLLKKKKKTGLHSLSNYIKYGDMPCNQISSNHESLRRTWKPFEYILVETEIHDLFEVEDILSNKVLPYILKWLLKDLQVHRP